MPNRRRGEVGVTLAGEPYTLCLTLGALADLEDAFGVADLAALAERLGSGRLGARDLLRLLGAALRGGGHPLPDAAVAALPLDEGALAALAEALADLLVATFGSSVPADPPGPQGA